MSQLADQLDNFPYLPIVSAISDLQKITIYYEKFNELYNSQKINKMKVHNLNLDVNMYQKDTCFLVQNQTGFGLEDTLLKLKGKPKQMKKKLKSIGPFFYVDGEFEFDKSMMIAALKIKKGIQKEQSFQKYKHLQGFTFVHIFEMSQKKKKRSRTAQQVMHNNKSCSINQEGISGLVLGLSKCQNMQILGLNLESNIIGIKGFLDLASTLSKFSNLTKLGLMLGSTQIGNTGISALASVLSSYTGLQMFQIKIYFSEIDIDGYFDFLSGLSLCTKLTVLSIQIQLNKRLANYEDSDEKIEIFNQKYMKLSPYKIKRLVYFKEI
ncbi:hypothetical protein ABPG73_017283 [Tetrahymena malaccensis]